MSYEEQLSAAKFRAERDQARQEVKELREELDAASKDAAERSKILEAARWVRDHGGLAHIMDIVNDFRAVVERIGVEWSESELHAIMGVLDSRLMPEGYEWSDGFAGAVDFFEAMHDLLYTIDGEERTGPEMVRDVMARLMPKGYEWPRYESGEPVRFGDVGLDVHGKRRKCYGVKFTNDGFTFVLDDMGRAWWGNDCGPLENPEIDPGKRVKRPAVLAADGEPLEVGQTVYDVDAEADTPLTVVEVSSDLVRCEYTWKDGKTYRPCYPPSVLTHTKPEPPDTWGLIWTSVTTGTTTLHEFERRCKALAKRGQ